MKQPKLTHEEADRRIFEVLEPVQAKQVPAPAQISPEQRKAALDKLLSYSQIRIKRPSNARLP